MALLEIPRLGLREVVVEGTSSGPMMSEPRHRRDTPGTSVIAGRGATYGGPFRSIDQLHAGDQITVTTGQDRNSCAVWGVRRAEDPLPPVLSRGQGRLTVVTTDGPATARRLLGVFGWSVVLAVGATATVWVRFRAGGWAAWVFGVPVLVTFGLIVVDEMAAILPNILSRSGRSPVWPATATGIQVAGKRSPKCGWTS